MSPQDAAAIQAQSDAFVEPVVRAYGTQRARGVLLQAVKLLLQRADALACRSMEQRHKRGEP